MSETQHAPERGHPTPFTYVKVAFALSLITGIEVGLFYIDMVPALFVACFFILSATKFVMVALFYMHLRYEARLFSTLFFGGVTLAIIVVVSVLAIFGVLLVDPTRESQGSDQGIGSARRNGGGTARGYGQPHRRAASTGCRWSCPRTTLARTSLWLPMPTAPPARPQAPRAGVPEPHPIAEA